MSYRDETALLRERSLGLELEHARLDGRRRGLELAAAEAEETTRLARAALAALPIRDKAKRATAATLGWIFGTAGTGAALALAIAALVQVCDAALAPEGGRTEGRVRADTRDDLVVGQTCTAVVRALDEEADREGDRCAVGIACGATIVFDGRGHCASVDGGRTLDAWAEGADTERAVVVPRLRLAIVRGPRGIVQISLRRPPE